MMILHRLVLVVLKIVFNVLILHTVQIAQRDTLLIKLIQLLPVVWHAQKIAKVV